MPSQKIVNNQYGNPTSVTVQTPAYPRWIPAFPQFIGNNTITNFDASVSWSGAYMHTSFTPCVAATKMAVVHWNSGTGVSFGESVGGGSGTPLTWSAQNRVQSNIMVGGVNQGSFTYPGSTNPATVMMDSLPRMSNGKAVTVTTSSACVLRFVGYKFDTSVNTQVPSNILANRKPRLAGKNVTTDPAAEVAGTGNVSGAVADGYCPLVVVESVSSTYRSWIIKGSSLAYGGTGWWVTGVQGSYPLSTNMDGATSYAEIALYRRADTANRHQSSVNIAEPGATMFRWLPQSAISSITPNTGFYSGRYALETMLGATDVLISDGVNAYSAASSGFNLTNYVTAMSQMLEQEIKRNIAMNRRTWFCLECLQTTSTNWSVAQTAAAFRDAQTPTLNGIGSGATANRAALKSALAAVCARYGSAWLIDLANIPCQVNGTTVQSLNSRDELVWNRVSSDDITYYTPTRYTGAEDGTHFGHAMAVTVGDYVANLIGTVNQTSFPPPGALN